MKLASLLPTARFCGAALDRPWNSEGRRLELRNLERESDTHPGEKKKRPMDWRVWRYQQCREAGVFEVSAKPRGHLYATAYGLHRRM